MKLILSVLFNSVYQKYYFLYHVINIKIILRSIFPHEMFKLGCVFYMYSTPQYGLVTFLRLDSHMWFVATVLGSIVLSVLYFIYFSNHMKNSL